MGGGAAIVAINNAREAANHGNPWPAIGGLVGLVIGALWCWWAERRGWY